MIETENTQMTTRRPSARARCRLSVRNPDDLPEMTRLLESAGLPARSIEPFIDTFMVAELDGALVGVGGIEVYGDTAVLRSVAVDDALRGTGVGHGLSVRLTGLAYLHRVNDIYLFTGEAWRFWEKQGFTEISLDDWRQPARASWQYAYVRGPQGVGAELRTAYHVDARPALDRPRSRHLAYSEELAARVRTAIGDRPDISERKMFGGIAFMVAATCSSASTVTS